MILTLVLPLYLNLCKYIALKGLHFYILSFNIEGVQTSIVILHKSTILHMIQNFTGKNERDIAKKYLKFLQHLPDYRKKKQSSLLQCTNNNRSKTKLKILSKNCFSHR